MHSSDTVCVCLLQLCVVTVAVVTADSRLNAGQLTQVLIVSHKKLNSVSLMYTLALPVDMGSMV